MYFAKYNFMKLFLVVGIWTYTLNVDILAHILYAIATSFPVI